MRQVVYDILTGAAPLGTVPAARVFQRMTRTELEMQNEFPFMLYGLREASPARVRPGARTRVTLWVYDEGGDYSGIDAALSAARAAFEAAVGTPTNDLIEIRWERNSQDDFDMGIQKIFKMGSFIVVHTT